MDALETFEFHSRGSSLFGPVTRIRQPNINIWNKSSPVTGPEGPRRFQEVKVRRLRDNGTQDGGRFQP
jgi:hypothetical protein